MRKTLKPLWKVRKIEAYAHVSTCNILICFLNLYLAWICTTLIAMWNPCIINILREFHDGSGFYRRETFYYLGREDFKMKEARY